jgi:hypothetical protein
MSAWWSIGHHERMQTLSVAPGAVASEGAAPAAPARLAAVAAVAVALLGGLLGPTGGLDGVFGATPVRVAAGIVEVQDGDAWRTVPVGQPVAPGVVFRVGDGIATLSVPGGTVELAPASVGTIDGGLALEAGSAVVQSPQLAAGDGVVEAQGAGAWRWDATGRAAAYDGATVLTDATGRQTLVRTLNEALVRDGVLFDDVRPLVYVGSDPFDRAWLAPAMGVDDLVAQLGRGLTATYGVSPQSPAFYEDFDGLDGQTVALLGDVGFERDGNRIGPPADVLIASVVTDALVTNAGVAPADAAAEVRTRRLAGATWGLIVQARELDASHVRAAAQRALERRLAEEELGTAVPVITPPPPEPAPVDEEPAPPPQEPTPPAPEPGPDEPEPEPEPGVVGGLVEDLGADELTDDLGPIGDVVDDTIVTIDDLIDVVLQSLLGSS